MGVAHFTDPDPNGTVSDYTATINWGDGTTSSGIIVADTIGAGFDTGGTHAYAEEGAYSITVTINDLGGSTATLTNNIQVLDPALTLQSSITPAPVEGATFTNALATFTDADPHGQISDYTATIIWGDGGSSSGAITANGNENYTVSGTYGYFEEGTYGIRVIIQDIDGGSVEADLLVNVGDGALSGTGASVSAQESASFSAVLASFTDAGFPWNLSNLSDYTASINWGDGTTSAGTVSQNYPGWTVSGTHTYSSEGNFTATVTISDVGGSQATVTSSVAVADAPLSASALTVSATEGASFSGVVASFTDADSNAVAGDFNVTITWGDGTTSAGTVAASGRRFTVTGTHTFAEEGSFATSVTINDGGGSTATVPGGATVGDAALSVTSGLSFGTFEGLSLTTPVLIFGDADPNAVVGDFSATINWGDGTNSAGWITTYGNSGFMANGTHTYISEGTYVVTVTVTDQGGSTTSGTSHATISDASLTASANNLSATEGGAALSGTVGSFTDADPNPTLGDFSATINWGDGTSSAGTILANGTSFTVAGTHAYASEGSFTITLTIKDVGGSQTTATATASVADAPLTASATNVAPVEGSSFSGGVATFSDADPNAVVGDFTATITWGDGNTSAGTIVANGSSFTVTGTHTYAEEGAFATSVTITDGGGSKATVAGTATVADAPLTGSTTNFSAIAGAPFTGTVATFTDADPNGTASDYAATITWADGSTSAGIITANGSGGFKVTGTHTYAAAGTYAVSVTIKDGSGSTATITDTATVTNLGSSIQKGQSAKISFWAGTNGQNLIDSFNGGQSSTALANWLATTFANMYGVNAGANNLTGMTNAQVASFYLTLYHLSSQLDAQVLATALNVYATTSSLGGNAATSYGFLVNSTGLGADSYNVGGNGAAFGVPNNTTLNVYQLLLATNSQAVKVLYNGNSNLRNQAQNVYHDINEKGGIG
jgi:hypothetical protein